MAGKLRDHSGGILGLYSEVLSDPRLRKAVQYDLLIRGYTLDDLGTEALSWYDLLVMLQYMQQDHSSALATEIHGAHWSVDAQLLAVVSDALAIANWQRAGRKHAPRPKPIQRPWDKPKTQSLGRDAIPISKFEDWWDSKASTPKPASKPRPKPHPPTAR
jgi:hypothetical protein